MSVTNDTLTQSNAGRGDTGPYSITFRFANPEDIKVKVNGGTPLTYGVDYSVTGLNLYTTGVYNSSDHTLTIYRETPITQPTEFLDGEPHPAESLEEQGLDRMAMISQELEDRIDELENLTLPTLSLSGDNIWGPAITYDTDDIVNYGGTLWVSLQDSNLNQTPSEGAWWTAYGIGATGATGAAGAAGATGATGPSSYTDAYDATVTYPTDAVVGYDGKLYISLQDSNLNHTPSGSSSWWSQLFTADDPCRFYATLSAHFTSTSTPIIFDVEEFDTESAYDHTTGIFTAPRDGLYLFGNGGIEYPSGTQHMRDLMKWNGSAWAIIYTYQQSSGRWYSNDTGAYDSQHPTTIVYLEGGDQVCQYNVAGGAYQQYSYFWGVELSARVGAKGAKGDPGIGVAWDSTVTYSSLAVVYHNNLLYRSLQGSNLNQNPSTETAWWQVIDLGAFNPVFDMQNDSTTHSFTTTSWADGIQWDAVTMPAGAKFLYHFYVPHRNSHSASWGGGYIQIQYRIDGGSWITIGDSGYKLDMVTGGGSIDAYANFIYFDFSDETAEFDIEFKWRHKVYTAGSTLYINGSQVIDGGGVTAGAKGQDQFWAHQIIQEIGVGAAKGDAGADGADGADGAPGLASSWSSATTYSIDQVVSHSGYIWVSLQNSNQNKDPDTETDWWEKITFSRSEDEWHNVGDAGEPAYQNSWVDYSVGFFGAGFRIDAAGTVHLRGLIKSGTVNATVFTLPVGYRPDKELIMDAESNNAQGEVRIQTTGNVDVESPSSNAWVSLEGITFNLGNTSLFIKGAPGDPALGDSWDSSTTYDYGQIAHYDGILYKSIQGTNTNKQPDTETAWWEELTYVDFRGGAHYGAKRFLGTGSGTSYTAGTLMDFTVEKWDDGNFWDSDNDYFVMPADGRYRFTISVREAMPGSGTNFRIRYVLNSVEQQDHQLIQTGTQDEKRFETSFVLDLSENDTVGFQPATDNVTLYQAQSWVSVEAADGAKGDTGATGTAGIASTWSNATTYDDRDIVSYGDKLYESRAAGNLNKVPDAEPDWWRLYVFRKIFTGTADPTLTDTVRDGDVWYETIT